MTTSTGEDLARVTVISPTRRIDLALPGTTSLAELMPNIVRFSGFEGAQSGDAGSTWVLQRFGEDPLDAHRPISDLNIRDGETLHLRQRENTIPDAAFDDVVDAVATSASTQPSWRPVDGRTFALATAFALAVAIPGFALATSSGLLVSLAVIALALGAGFVAVLLSRAFGLKVVAGTLGWISVTLAGIGGFHLLEPAPSAVGTRPIDLPIQVLTCAALVLVLAGAMALGTQITPYHFLGAALVALGVIVTAMAVVLMPDAMVKICAIALAVSLGITPLLPKLSFALAGVAMPNLPSTADALMADRQPVQADIVERAIAADKFLAALLIGTAGASTLVAIPVIVAGTGWAPGALLTAAGVALLLRARAFVGRTARLSLLLAGSVLTLVAVWSWLSSLQSELTRAAAGIAILLVAVWLLTQYASSMYNKILSPVWGRWGDIIEWLAIIAIVPMVLAVCEAYQWAYGLAG